MLEGRILGDRYKILEKVGTGGMAAVYRGTDNVLGRTVAIKVMLPQYASDPTFAARFRQEAQAAASLTSPYIVNIYDWGQDGSTYYIVMEFLRGTDLKTGIRTHGALAPKKVAQIAAQVCAALAVAHRHEIIHRDIKPQNIMIQPDGSAKVMDFGIARAKNSHLTQTNSVLGTAHYVSPEQTQGKELGAESDLYSLGIVMYEAVTGKVPFEGDEAVSVALKQVNEAPVPPSQVNEKIDPEFEAIIMKLLSKRPEDRFRSADELRRILNNYIAGRPTGLAPAAYPSYANETTVLPRGAEDSTTVLPRASQTAQLGGAAQVRQPTYDYEEEKKPIWPFIVGIFALLGVIAAALFFILGDGDEKLVTVPEVVGMTQAEATTALTAEGFNVARVDSQYSEEEEGIVVDQDPDGGLQKEAGSDVNLVISKGPEPAQAFDVPVVTGMTEAEAKNALTQAGLVPQAGDPVNDDSAPVGTVVSQTPAAGSKVVEGDTVVYVISLGTESVEVPSMEGQSLDVARASLEAAGLTASGFEEQFSDDVPTGRIISHDPAAGSSVPKGSGVNLVVSKGPEPAKTVTVPSVLGMGEAAAKARLESDGLVVNVAYTEGANSELGTVVDQDPGSGTVDVGSTINILVVNQIVQPEQPRPEQPEPEEPRPSDPATGNGNGNG